MRVIQFSHYGDPDVLVVDEVPMPEPAEGQVRVRVLATAVQPADVLARAGSFAAILPRRSSYRPGWDFYGVLDAADAPAMDPAGLRPGDPVIGMTDWLRDLNGTHADYVVLDRDAVVPAPAGLPGHRAAALPVTAVTAVQALAMLSDAGTIAVLGAAGNVGGFALELAAAQGRTVFGIASTGDRAFIEARGGVFVDREGDPADSIRARVPGGVDAVFDTASLGRPILAAVRDAGTYVGVIAPFAPPTERRITIATVGVHTDRDALQRVAALAAEGHLTPRVAAQLPLDRAAEAHRLVEQGGRRGAVILETAS